MTAFAESAMRGPTLRRRLGVLAMAVRRRLGLERRFLQLWATIGLFALAYASGAFAFPVMRDAQAFLNLFITTPFLLICVVGETFVVLSGGIDLSVSGIVALTTVASAALLVNGWNPWLVIVLMLGMGLLFGLVMGVFITYLKVQPFIATLAGMWLARGLCYIISDAEIRIYDHTWQTLARTKILIPILADPTTKTGPYVSLLVVVAVLVLIVGLYLAHLTRFGRTVYSIGGGNGANEQSARLMGLPVNRTKVAVYMISGFCSALAGLAYSIYVGSGHGTHATGFELTVIAAVVIGGIALTGGEGYLIGGLVGVLITALIQALILYQGQLSSWWTSIVIGALMLLFIGVQSILASLSSGRSSRRRFDLRHLVAVRERRPRRQTLATGALAVGGIAIVALLLSVTHGPPVDAGTAGKPNTGPCQLKPARHDQVDKLITEGAVIAYERNGGSNCVDEVFGVYADGRVVGDAGGKQATHQVDTSAVTNLLTEIERLEWFTPDMYTTTHTPCGACFSYYINVSYKGQQKAVGAVDGGTDAPSNYWLVATKVAAVLPRLDTAP